MELTPRKKKILCEIVKAYIASGEPIGSKMLCNITDLNLSSATVRNEMSDLCEMGYLKQPHTSAGRVPTSEGYRLYVKELLGTGNISPQMQYEIDSVINKISQNPENITANAGQALSDLTGFPAVSLTIPDKGAFVKRVDLLPLGRRMAMIVLITSNSIATSRLCRTSEDITPTIINMFDNVISKHVIGVSVNTFNNVYLQTIAAGIGIFGFSLMPLLSTLFDMIESVCRYQLDLKGTANMYSIYGKEEDARKIADFVLGKDAVYSMLSEITDPVGVLFGDESGIEILKPSSFVIARFGGGESRDGRIGVMGPTRMSYEDLIPSVAYFAKQLENVIKQASIDLGD